MKTTGYIQTIGIDYKTSDPVLTIKVEDNLMLKEAEKLNDKKLAIDLSIYREKRSLNANNYAWKLIGEIANILRADKNEVYLKMLKRYGQSEAVSVKAEIEVDGYFKYFEEFGETMLNGKLFKHYKIFKGSSEYDTREMSIFVDGIVSECKEMGIETLTPTELQRMKEEWR